MSADPIPLCERCKHPVHGDGECGVLCFYDLGGAPGNAICMCGSKLQQLVDNTFREYPQPDELTRLRAEVEQLQVQLAGCGAAALGATKDPAKPGDYGWSPAYQDVLNLRLEVESLRKQIAEQGWQPIGTAPKDGTNVLTWHMGGIATMAFLTKEKYGRDPGGWYFLDKWRHWSWCQPAPKYWRALPDAPIDRAMEKAE